MTSMPPNPSSRRWLAALVALMIVPGAATWYVFHRAHSSHANTAEANSSAANAAQGQVVSFGGTQVAGVPKHVKPSILAVPTKEFVASVVVDFHAPDRVLQALQANAWVREALNAPVGRGFLGSWSGFLGARGSDLRAGFEGTLFDFFATKLLATPFRVVWFGGASAPVTPAIIVSKPSATVQAAFTELDGIIQRGVSTATTCPVKAGAKPNPQSIKISRWLVADHPMFAGVLDDRMVFGRNDQAVLAGLCVKLAEVPPTEGADLDVSLLTAGLGRESELMTTLLGTGPSPRLAFAVEGDHLVPKGIASELVAGGRLDSAPIAPALLKLVPEGVPVMFALQVRLPTDLSAESLKAHFANHQAKEELTTRQAVLLWYPSGRDLTDETALIWSRVEDAEALKTAFNDPWDTVCGQQVLVSNPKILWRIREACAGRSPSIDHASPAVVAGLEEPTSVTLGVNLGKLLGQLTTDAYLAESKKTTAPPEIEKARDLLEELPFVGLRGVVKGGALVPGGFRS